jgi:Protein of unknown function (DUF 659)
MGEVFLKAIDTSGETKSAAYIAAELAAVIEEIGPQNVVQVCQSGPAPTFLFVCMPGLAPTFLGCLGAADSLSLSLSLSVASL